MKDNMNLIKTFLFSFVFSWFFFFPFNAHAQQKKAQTYQQQVQAQHEAQHPTQRAIVETKVRLVANFEYTNTSPKDLNDYRSQSMWVGTPAAAQSFGSLSGFSVGVGYKVGQGYLSLELEHGSQVLSNAAANASGTTTVQDSVEYQTVQIVYDWIYQTSPDYSFEIGLGLGEATQFHYVNALNVNGTLTTINWGDTPFVYKLRGFYSYHFSENVRFRVGAAYEGLSSNGLKAEADYNATYGGQPITKGLPFNDANNQSVKMDLSGFRASAGIVVAF